jgi:hypothetical protein
VLATLSCRSHIFKKGVRKVIICDVKWREVKWGDLKHDKCLKVEGSEKLGVKILGGMYVLIMDFNFVVWMWIAVQYVLLLSHCYLLYVLLFVMF